MGIVTPQQVARVKDLIAAGNSTREIARKTGVSRDTVAFIRTGLQSEHQARHCRECGRKLRRSRFGRCVQCTAGRRSVKKDEKVKSELSVEEIYRRAAAERELRPEPPDARYTSPGNPRHSSYRTRTGCVNHNG